MTLEQATYIYSIVRTSQEIETRRKITDGFECRLWYQDENGVWSRKSENGRGIKIFGKETWGEQRLIGNFESILLYDAKGNLDSIFIEKNNHETRTPV